MKEQALDCVSRNDSQKDMVEWTTGHGRVDHWGNEFIPGITGDQEARPGSC